MDNGAVIYLSDRRLCQQSPVFRCYQTPIEVEPILRFEDNTLAAQQSVEGQFDSNRIVVFLPLVGAIEVADRMVETGEVLYLFVEKGETIRLQNPYESELINYLEIHIEAKQTPTDEVVMVGFDLENKNQLHGINLRLSEFEIRTPKSTDLQSDTVFYIGKYDGRKDDILSFSEPTNVFIFIINGAFEVQNRLLESRDGLLLNDVSEIDFEALSNEAIILVVRT
jgi:quercetin 2,3-dioxygenase